MLSAITNHIELSYKQYFSLDLSDYLMNPTLRQMRAFVAVTRTGNFTLAAQSLHVTQSALSGLIKELEQTLEAKVIDRSTRRITLTDIGKELFPLFSQMIE